MGASQLIRIPVRVVGALAGMDDQGELILGTYFQGGGKPVTIYEDPNWSEYMMKHDGLRRQIYNRLILAVKDQVLAHKTIGRFPIADMFHAEFDENRGFSGYALLHGTDRTVGDFKFVGSADVQDAVNPAEDAYDIRLDLRFEFNDLVNPNKKYLMDTIRNWVAEAVTLGAAESYRILISWRAYCLVEVRGAQPLEYYGYPSGRPIPVRPMPRATLKEFYIHDMDGYLMPVLQQRFQATDVAGYGGRVKKLESMFRMLRSEQACLLLSRLEWRRTGDKVSETFHAHLHTDTRKKLTEVLRKRCHGTDM